MKVDSASGGKGTPVLFAPADGSLDLTGGMSHDPQAFLVSASSVCTYPASRRTSSSAYRGSLEQLARRPNSSACSDHSNSSPSQLMLSGVVIHQMG